MTRLLTVEIHDVSPLTFGAVRRIHRGLGQLGVTRPSLLVIPAHVDGSGRLWDLRRSPEVARWLARQVAEGAEVIQHGLTHRAPSAPPRSWRYLADHAMHRWFSRGEAELAHVTARDAARRIRRGREVLSSLGLRADGFIAPAWQQSAGALAAVAQAGFAFTAFLGHVQPLVGDRTPLRTPALTFAAANGLVDRGKRGVMLGLERLHRRNPLLRVALHPVDAGGALPHILRRVRRLLGERRLTSYGEWLAGRDLARAA